MDRAGPRVARRRVGVGMSGDDWIEREADWLPGRRREDRREEPEIPVAGEAPLPAVLWVPVYCPNRRCRSRDCPATGTPGDPPGMRYHKCRQCGLSFKSFERGPPK